MFRIFLRPYQYPPLRTFPIKVYSRMDFVKRMVNSEMNKILDYYSKRERDVTNNHLLVRLINLCVPDIELNDVTFRSMASSDYLFNTRQLGIVSDVSYGEYHENLFYSSNTTDVLCVVENDINWFDKQSWINMPAIRCIYHTITDLDYYPMFRTKGLKDPALFVYEIDVMLLLMQFKHWALERKDNDMIIHPARFLAMKTFPNIIPNMMNIAMFNRFIKISTNDVIKPYTFDHPFHVMDFTKDIDRVLGEVADDTKGEGVFIEQLLATIPAVCEENMERALRIHKYFYNRYSEWVLWIARTGYIRKLLEYLDVKGEIKNRDELNYLPEKIRRLENRSTLIKLPSQFLSELDNDIYKIKQVLGKR